MTKTGNSRKKLGKTIKDMLKMIEKEMKKGKFGLGNIDSECECYRGTGAVEEGEMRRGKGRMGDDLSEALRLMWKD